MKTRSLLNKLAKKYPKRLAAFFDHPGLQTGKLKEETKTVLLCLDFDEIVMDFMEQNNLTDKVDMIITHHPFIFGTKYRVFQSDENKKKLCDKIDSYDIPIYSFHTNFDEGQEGMNDALTEALGLLDVKPLDTEPMARGGRLPEPMNVVDFAKYAKKCFNVDYSLLLDYGKQEVSTVAIVGGGGWSSWKKAMNEGYDIYISGDAPHHARRDVISYHYNYLDMPHEIEKIFVKQMKKVIRNIDDSINVIVVDHEVLPKVI